MCPAPRGADIGAGLSGTFVVKGSPTKTQMVDSAGGRTQLSLLVTAAIVLLVLLFFTEPLAYMSAAVLSAIVFMVGVELIDVRGMRSVFEQRRSEFWVALITALMVVLVGAEQDILLSIVLSLIDHTRRGYRPRNVVLMPSVSGQLRVRPVASGAPALPNLLIYRLTHSLHYANAQHFAEDAFYDTLQDVLVDHRRPHRRTQEG
jgi:MFS superfamily sulfate permease-like transporter